MRKKKITPGGLLLNLISIAMAVIYLAPVAFAFFVSLQHEGKPIKTIFSWFTPPYTLENYPFIIMNSQVPTWLFNSIFISVVSTVLTLIVTSLAAYAIAKIPFKGSRWFFLYFLLGMMVPGEATIVPLFITVNKLKLIDSYAGMILPGIAGSMNLIIMTSFFKGIPDELLEAVKMDGGGFMTMFTKIIIPLSKTILSTVRIFSFIGSWNSYLWPLLCAMSSEMFTLPIGVPTFAGTYTVDYVLPLTASMVASLPMLIIYIIFEKRIVSGITLGAIKG